MYRTIRKVPILVLALLFIGFSEASELEESLKFESKEAHSYFIGKLNQQSISHRIDQSGMVWYRANDRKKVQQIRSEVISTYHPGNAVTFQNNTYSKILQRKMEEAGISYRVIQRDKKEVVAWQAKDSKKVEILIKEVRDIVNKDKMEEFLSKRNTVK